jgi:hypothetical protein
LQAQAAKLNHVERKSDHTAHLNPEEIQAVANLYTQEKGNLEVLAKKCGVSVDLLRKQPPQDATEFATKLLIGCYTGETSEIVKGEFRDRLLQDLQQQSGKLRRTETKEVAAEPSAADIEVVGKLYSDANGDLDKLAASCGANPELLRKRPPADAADFAKKLLGGVYTGDTTELAKSQLRDELLEGIQKQAGQLKRAHTKEVAAAPADSDIACVAKIYSDSEGNLDKVAAACGMRRGSLEMLKKHPPADANEFAKKLLEGTYSAGDSSELAKADFRSQLLEGLRTQGGKLKRADTKEVAAGPQQADIDCVAKIYTSNNGNLGRIAEACGANPDMLKTNPPTDAQDFARKMLEGHYTGDTSGFAKAHLRDRLCEDLQAQAMKLKRTETKEVASAPGEADVEAIAKVFTQHGGNLEKIAPLCGANLVLLQKTPPADATDFAKKLLEGLYTGDDAEMAKTQLRDHLASNLQAQAGKLKRTQTKEVSGTPATRDMEAVAKIYVDSDGDLAKIAAASGANLQMMQKMPPNDANDFAKKLLEGAYTGEASEIAKRELRDHLHEDIQVQRTTLKRTNTKESPTIPTAKVDDVTAVGQVFTKHNGNLDAIAKATGARVELLKKRPPEDAADFAKKLLEGCYTADNSEFGKAVLRDRLAADLTEQAGKLRRTTTKASMATPLERDIHSIAELYTSCGGNVEKLVEITGLKPELLKKHAPKSPEDFAQKMLEGWYTGNQSELAKKQLRHRLRADLMAQKKELRRTSSRMA